MRIPLTIQHFVRVLSIVIFVPFMFFILTGEVVGSASGVSMSKAVYGASDISFIFIIAAIGLVVGKAINLPAAHLLGPLMLAMLAVIVFSVQINFPHWLLNCAQFVIGTTLGAQFSGVNRRMLRRSLRLGAITVCFMLILSSAFAYFLTRLCQWMLKSLNSFAAGGLAEMSLIALSFNLNPVFVALHHLLRIFLSIWLGNLVYNYFLKNKLRI